MKILPLKFKRWSFLIEGFSEHDTQVAVDSHMDTIIQAMPDFASSVSGKNRSLKPKSYWCAELSMLRDKKRFWWHLWVCNDRPMTGSVYKIYKSVKKLFRQTNVNVLTTSIVIKLENLPNSGDQKGTLYFGIQLKSENKKVPTLN